MDSSTIIYDRFVLTTISALRSDPVSAAARQSVQNFPRSKCGQTGGQLDGPVSFSLQLFYLLLFFYSGVVSHVSHTDFFMFCISQKCNRLYLRLRRFVIFFYSRDGIMLKVFLMNG